MRFVIDCTAGTPDDLLPNRVKAITRERGSFGRPGHDKVPEYATDRRLHFAIDIESLDDLLAVRKLAGSDLIIREASNIGSGIRPEGWPEFKDALPEIEIYNDYRE